MRFTAAGSHVTPSLVACMTARASSFRLLLPAMASSSPAASASTVLPVAGAPEFMLEVRPATPGSGVVVEPYARHCLWDRALYAQAGEWFGSYRAVGRSLGLAFVLMSKERFVARMRLDSRHRQPTGLLHGGISALVAEEMGSIGAHLCGPFPALGISVSATHLSSARADQGGSGGDQLVCVAQPIKGRGKLQVWAVDLYIDTEEDDPLRMPSDAATTDTAGAQALFWRDWRPSARNTHIATCTLTALARKPTNEADSGKRLTSKL